MVQGIEVDLFRPDDELRRLAKLAVELDVADALASGGVDEALAAVAARPQRRGVAGRLGGAPRIRGSTSPRATASTAATRSGSTTSRSRSASCATTSRRVQAGRGHRPPDGGDRRRARPHHRASTARCCPTTRCGRRSTRSSGLSRLVFPYVENHNFYVEHWALSVFWRKIRELGAGARGRGLLARTPTTSSTCAATSSSRCSTTTATAGRSGAESIGPVPLAGGDRAQATASSTALETKAPPPAMNEPPAVVTEPFTIMLYGITTDSVNQLAVGLGRQRRAVAAWPPRPARPRASARVVQRRGRSRPDPGGRDPRRAHHRAELGAGVRPRRARSSPTSAA